MPEKLLAGKCALITGAGGGIGRASALLFASEGARVVAIEKDVESGTETIDLVRRTGGEGAFFETDVTDGASVEAAIQKSVDLFGRLDTVFNVVGVSGRRWGDGPVGVCTEEAWDRVMTANLKSMFLCCKYAVREMLELGGGSIINVSSVLGLVGGDADFATHAYAASKGGVISLTRSIASYYATSRIRANVICPALIATPMSRRAQTDPHIQARLKDLQPLSGTFGKPEDVAQAALYLASDGAAFVTGAVLTVDGGWTVR